MWPPSEWELRAALDHATPQQRQQVIQGGGKPAEVATRLNMAEDITRQKLKTPPPPQGTVMNQYYQWPQQADDMGLGQPGLEELAQQYASGGLIAFEEGGPVRGFSKGGESFLDYLTGPFDPERDPSEDLLFYDVGRDVADEEADIQRLQNLPSMYSEALAEGEDLPPTPTGPQEAHPLSDYTHWLGKIGLGRDEDAAIQAAIDKKSSEQEAKVDAMEGRTGPSSGMPAMSPEAMAALSPERRAVGSPSQAGIPSMLAQYEGGNDVPRVSGLRDANEPTVVIKQDGEPVERTTGGTSSKVPKVTFADRVELAKQYLGIDTSKAMDFVSAMEKRAAHEGNMGMISAIASAAGLGLGAYGSGSHRWGTALAGLASGVMGAAERESQAMDKIDAAKLRLAEEEGKAEKEAFKYVTDKEVAAAAKAAQWQHEKELEQMKGGYKVNAAAAGAAGKGALTPAGLAKLEIDARDVAIKNEGTKWSLMSEEERDAVVTKIMDEALRAAGYEGISPQASSPSAAPTYQSKLGVTYRPPVS